MWYQAQYWYIMKTYCIQTFISSIIYIEFNFTCECILVYLQVRVCVCACVCVLVCVRVYVHVCIHLFFYILIYLLMLLTYTLPSILNVCSSDSYCKINFNL